MNELPDNRLFTACAPLPCFELIPARSALGVVDMQYVDAHPDCGIGRAATEGGTAVGFCNVRITDDVLEELHALAQ